MRFAALSPASVLSSLAHRSAKKPRVAFHRLRLEVLEDRVVPATRWLGQFNGIVGETRADQLVDLQQRFADANLAAQGISIIDHVGFDGVVLVSAPDGTLEPDFENSLSVVPGYFEADVFDPFATATSEIAVYTGPMTRRPPASGPSGPSAPDPEVGPPGPTPPSGGNGFDGIIAAQGGNFRPPDTTGAVGPSSFVQAVNNAIAIYNKSGGVIAGPVLSGTFFGTPGGNFIFDPVVVYNDVTQRFAVGFVEADNALSTTALFRIAISKTSNPTTLTTADWDLYVYNVDDSSAGYDFADYPKMGYNADGYVVSFNQFKNASFYDHSATLSIANNGTSPGVQIVPGGITHFTLAPASMHDTATGAPMWFVENGGHFSGSKSSVNVVSMTSPYSATPTFTFFSTTVSTYHITQSPHDPGGQLVGNSNLGTRFYFTGQRTVAGVNHLVAAHTSAQTLGNAFSDVRWYDFDITGATPTVIQQGAINAGATTDTFFPDADINASGTIGLGYMQGSATQGFSNYGTGRLATDPLGTMQTPVLGVTSTANLKPRDRIGDYADISVDPADGSFWYTAQYQNSSTPAVNWRTWIQNYAVVPPNQFPTADAAGPYQVNEGSTVGLDGSGSMDTDGTIATYEWDFDYDGMTFNVDATGATPTFSAVGLNGPTSRTVGLRVTDDDGDTDIDTAMVNILNRPPTAAAGGPYQVNEGSSVPLDGTGSTDFGFGSIVTYQWDFDYDGMTFNVDATGATPTFNAAGLDGDSSRTIGLRVTDDDGDTSTVATTTLDIDNVDPLVTPPADQNALENVGQLFDLGSFTDPGPDAPWLVTINWGDGSLADTFNANSTGSLGQFFHVFVNEGPFQVKVTVDDGDGGVVDSFFDVFVANTDIVAVGADLNDPGRVFVFDATTHEELYVLTPFGESHRGGVRVAVGDVNGDGKPDIVAAQGGVKNPSIRVYHGSTGLPFAGALGSFKPFNDASSIKGAFVAVGELDGLGSLGLPTSNAEIIVGADKGGKPLVRVFDGATGARRYSFSAYENSFGGGVRVAVAAVPVPMRSSGPRGIAPFINAIVTTPGKGRKLDVRFFDGANGAALPGGFQAFNTSYHNEAFVAAGDLDGDGFDEIIIGAARGQEGGDVSRLRVFDGETRSLLTERSPYGNHYRDDLRVAAGDVTGDGIIDLLIGGGPSQPLMVGVYDGETLLALEALFGEHDGAFVGGAARRRTAPITM